MTNEKRYYTVKTVREIEQPNGKVKKVSEAYLVNAISVTDAEAKMYSHLKDEPFEWQVKSANETKYLEVIN